MASEGNVSGDAYLWNWIHAKLQLLISLSIYPRLWRLLWCFHIPKICCKKATDRACISWKIHLRCKWLLVLCIMQLLDVFRSLQSWQSRTASWYDSGGKLINRRSNGILKWKSSIHRAKTSDLSLMPKHTFFWSNDLHTTCITFHINPLGKLSRMHRLPPKNWQTARVFAPASAAKLHSGEEELWLAAMHASWAQQSGECGQDPKKLRWLLNPIEINLLCSVSEKCPYHLFTRRNRRLSSIAHVLYTITIPSVKRMPSKNDIPVACRGP